MTKYCAPIGPNSIWKYLKGVEQEEWDWKEKDGRERDRKEWDGK